MRYTFTGKNITVTDSLKERAVNKINRIHKLLPENVEVFVAFKVSKNEHKAEVTIPLKKRTLRAEVATMDMNTSIDEVVDILEKQINKYKGRLHNRMYRDASFKEELAFMPADESPEEGVNIVIEKTKRFALKPMDPEEAVMEMELLGHDFYVFFNAATEDINVVYRRGNGTFGLIEPEL